MSPGRAIFDQFATPPVATLLGWQLIDSDQARRWVRISFNGKAEFKNPAGFIQGGMLAAMLDDTMGPAVLIATNGEFFTTTIDMNISFLNPAKGGVIFGEATVVQMGKTVAFLEGQLTDEAGTVLARATSSARMVGTNKIPIQGSERV